jgi:hypothetical protein
MKNILIGLSAFVYMAVLPSTGNAAVFSLSENLSGLDSLPAEFADLPASLDGLNTPFPVGIGTNVIIGGFGCIFFSCQNKPINQTDVFRIEVPTGLQLSSIFLGTSDVHRFQLAPTGGADLFLGSVFSSGQTLTPGVNLPAGSLGAGIYDLAIFKQSSGNWRFEFNAELASPVSEVPIPAALPLYGTGLALIGFFGRRRRRLNAA